MPAEAGDRKYDATAGSMIGLLKYGSGLPFNRLDGLQGYLEVPLPASTQWDIVKAVEEEIAPAFAELVRQAAQGDVLHNDDTTVKILELMGEAVRRSVPRKRGTLRTSAPACTRRAWWRCATATAWPCSSAAAATPGENLAEVLEAPRRGACRRRSRCAMPCPATCRASCRRSWRIAWPMPGGGSSMSTIASPSRAATCSKRWPWFITTMPWPGSAACRPRPGCSSTRKRADRRWRTCTTGWTRQLGEKRTEPNSALGGAIRYMLRHWEKLTLFLRQAGAPLDNNMCERALKKAILHRKNALFYKTRNGARVGDLFMSLIYTCQLNEANPFDYLTELQRHADAGCGQPRALDALELPAQR